jgi:flagellum-specific ATP synthase
MSVLAPEILRLRESEPLGITGHVDTLRGLTVLVEDFPAPVGALVEMDGGVLGEVAGFAGGRSVVMTYGGLGGVCPGQAVRLRESRPTAAVGRGLLGRVVNGLGGAIDGKGPVRAPARRALAPAPIEAMRRTRIDAALRTGVRALDLMTPVGKGQRLGIFAGPGVGKSTLLGQIARGTSADVSVIALIGERGREVREFIEESLGEEGLARSVLVVATGDESPLLRLHAARLACAVAEQFRDEGRDVLLMMDSVTRFAHAQRQVGLSAGEPPSTRGYTPSVFSELPLLLERAGTVEGTGGSITGLYTILVEGDDMTEPVADAARGILDGHVILSRRLAQKGHYPAIDVLDSISRVAPAICDPAHTAASAQLARMLALHREVEELVQIGAYARGSDAETDVAIEFAPAIHTLLRQGVRERAGFDESRSALVRLAMQTGEEVQRRTQQARSREPAPERGAQARGRGRGERTR